MDAILDQFGLQYEDLNSAEREQLTQWLNAIQSNQLTVDKIREAVANMRYGCEKELVEEPEFIYIFIFKVPNRKQILLKARLKNYMLLEAFLSTPDKAKAALEQALSQVKKT